MKRSQLGSLTSSRMKGASPATSARRRKRSLRSATAAARSDSLATGHPPGHQAAERDQNAGEPEGGAGEEDRHRVGGDPGERAGEHRRADDAGDRIESAHRTL